MKLTENVKTSRRIVYTVLIGVALLFAGPQEEIKYLVEFVKNTQCSFERNGTRYTGVEAVNHINKKYRYYSDDIKTAEDFIRLSATKSSMSGKLYYVHCGDSVTLKSSVWLLNELAEFRSRQVPVKQ